MSLQAGRLLFAIAVGLLAAGVVPPAARAEPWPPVPTARYASLEAARDSIGAMVSRCVSHADTAIHISSEPVTFEYLYAKATGRGWAFHITVNDTSSCPDDATEQALNDAGWVESFGYSADGADGSTMGYVCRDFFCLVEGQWDGGNATDESYIPEPGCKVTITCVPRRKDDTPRQ